MLSGLENGHPRHKLTLLTKKIIEQKTLAKTQMLLGLEYGQTTEQTISVNKNVHVQMCLRKILSASILACRIT